MEALEERDAGGMERIVRGMRTGAEEEMSWDFQKRN